MKVIITRRIFMEKLNPVKRQFPCNNKSAQENKTQKTYASVIIY